jgi:alpha,alpha-trehalose-phosphate synthase [UDP-forming]
MDEQGLRELVHDKLGEYLFIVVSNREPYIHSWAGDEVKCVQPASGLAVALDPVVQACGGLWVAHGCGTADADVVDGDGKIRVPPEESRYTLKRIWLSKADEEGYYDGFSNKALWPLCHVVYIRPEFNQSDWDTYQKVNKLFAQAVLEETNDRKAFVFIQDYHLALVAQYIKQQQPGVVTAHFWHIPWPNHEAFRICPWREEILQGLLANDLLGFHTAYYCNNFLETVDRELECKIERERYAVTRGGHNTLVRPFPIGVAFDRVAARASARQVTREMERLRRLYGLRTEFIGLGIDRVDYTKGIPERLEAVNHFLEKYPEYERRLTFVQVGAPSRMRVERYQHINDEIEELVDRINWRHQSGHWRPIVYINEHCYPNTLTALSRMAHFCVVSPLQDGMNLVAKEYVSSKLDRDGVLILSQFTGAASELQEALLVNPYSVDDIVEGIKRAVEMPREEKQRRMSRMRKTVRSNNIYQWAADIITELSNFEFPEA